MAIPAAIILGRVVGGKFLADDPSLFRRAFYTHECKEVELSISRRKKRRTSPQNAFYHGVVVPMVGDAIGEQDAEAVHSMLKAEFNYVIRVVGGKEIRVPMSTAQLKTDEFEAYLERIRIWAAEFLSLYIPLPNEVV